MEMSFFLIKPKTTNSTLFDKIKIVIWRTLCPGQSISLDGFVFHFPSLFIIILNNGFKLYGSKRVVQKRIDNRWGVNINQRMFNVSFLSIINECYK